MRTAGYDKRADNIVVLQSRFTVSNEDMNRLIFESIYLCFIRFEVYNSDFYNILLNKLWEGQFYTSRKSMFEGGGKRCFASHNGGKVADTCRIFAISASTNQYAAWRSLVQVCPTLAMLVCGSQFINNLPSLP